MSLIFQQTSIPGQTLPRHGIYVGGRDDAKDLARLKSRSVTHVLNLTPAKQVNVQAGVPNFFETTLTYKRIPVYDSPTSVPAFRQAVDEIVDFISKGLCHGSVLVHCQKGASRSVTAVAVYLMRREHMSSQDALELIQRRRPSAQPIPAFVEFLESLDSQPKQVVGPQRDTTDRNNNVEETKHSDEQEPKRRRIHGPSRNEDV